MAITDIIKGAVSVIATIVLCVTLMHSVETYNPQNSFVYGSISFEEQAMNQKMAREMANILPAAGDEQ